MSIRCGCDELRWRRLLSRRHLLKGGVGLAALALPVPGRRFVALAQEGTPTAGGELVSIADRQLGPIGNDSFVNPLVEIYGDVAIGHRVYVAGNTILYAADGRRISLGDETNVQDNVYLLARDQDTTFQTMVSIAHQAVVENSVVADFTFFGFRSRTRNAVVEEGSMIMHNTVVENVTIPANRITPVGAHITTQAEADALPELTEANDEFKHEVQEVNHEFAAGYITLFDERGRAALEGIGPNPLTSWNPAYVDPVIGDGVFLEELVRIVGNVQLGEGSRVGQRTAIRADEGNPITIGRRARIGSRVTFHALKGTTLTVGDHATIGNSVVLHGPLAVADNFVAEDETVVFQATIEDNVTVRRGATVAGDLLLREGTIVPEGAVVTTQAEADALPTR